MLIHIHPENPQPRLVQQVVECLQDGGIIIYPTDTIYGIGCDMYKKAPFEKICRLKKIDPQKANLSFICRDLSHLSDFTKGISTPMFRNLKHYLPGPYTFIFEASKQVPKMVQNRRSTVGLRVPDNEICRHFLAALGNPILSASLPGDMVEEYTDPEIIYDKFKNDVDLVIDGGPGGIIPSTIIDCTGNDYQIIRQGAGEFEA